jgi:uncharacterized damage-inducible protein DinB
MEIVPIPAFLAYHENVRARTLRVVNVIPPEHIEWAPRAGAFTFGDLVRHLGAIERYMFAENVVGRPSRYPGHGRELADGHEAVLAYLERTHRESVEIFRGLGPDDLQRRCTTPGAASIPVWKWLRSMTEHEIHHRGQLYLMLNLLGVPTPPLYGLTSEEVQARSTAEGESSQGAVP